VNVSLPRLAMHATPVKTLPGATALAEKFSLSLAEAQDTTDASMPDVLNDSGSHVPKKMSAKSDKSNSKSSAVSEGSTFPNPTPVVNSAAAEVRAALASAARPFWQNGSSLRIPPTGDPDVAADSLAATKSGSDSPRAFPSQLSPIDPNIVAGLTVATKSIGDASTHSVISGGVVSSQPEPTKTDSPNPAADNQQAVVSSTSLLSTWMAPEAGTSFKSLAPTANSEASATPNGKPESAGAKTVSADTARGTTSALDTKTPTGFTPLQSHAPVSTAPPTVAAPKPVVRPSSNPATTKRELLQAHALNGGSTGRQERAVTRAFADISNEDFDGASDDATQLGRANSLASAAPPAGNGNSAAAAPSSAVSMQFTSPAVDSRTGGVVASPKTSDALTHGLSTVAADDAEAGAEAAALSTSSPLHTAKLMAGMERSELRMGLRTGEFGNVDIRTSLVRNQFTAEISAERGELGRALAAELPNLQHRLTEQHLPAASITVQDHSSGGSSDFQQGSRPGQSAPPVSVSGRTHEDSPLPMLPVEATEATARLDIHM